jgi:hypothetical protein
VRQPMPGFGEARSQPVDPEPTVRVQHHLDDRWLLKLGGDGRSEGGAQHSRSARAGELLERMKRHGRPWRSPRRE